jgi:tetratricopeptide (TPR) repeat protein
LIGLLSNRLIVISAIFVSLLLVLPPVEGQCINQTHQDELDNLYQQKNWVDVITLAARLNPRTAAANFEYGMALAHLQRWDEARAALIEGRRECSQQKRFPIELAGLAFERKRYPEAASWIEKGLALDPGDEYANDFAGTVFLLLGNLDAALKYWNRIQKPKISALQLDPQLQVQRLLLERAFVFSPQAVMKRADFRSTLARLDGLGIFPAYSIQLNTRSDGKFDADFHAIERNGFGNGRLQSVLSAFSGLPYETLYPSYFNIAKSATNFDSLLRWDKEKRRAWFSLSGPMRYLPQWRWALSADGRDENWSIRRSSSGDAPALASFKLKRESATGTVSLIHSGRLQAVSGAELAHRTYSNISSGSALNSDLVTSAFELKHLASLNAQVLDVPEHRFRLNVMAASELARMWSNPPHLFEKGQGGAVLHWLPGSEGDKYEFVQRIRGGGIAGTAPVDELSMIGVERDNDLWLRGHIGTRDGRKGSSPMADRFLLLNSDFYRSVYTNGLISIKAGPLLDVAKAAAPTSGLAPRQWMFDAGLDLKLTVLGTSVVLTYGRDLRMGNNAFYGSVAQR